MKKRYLALILSAVLMTGTAAMNMTVSAEETAAETTEAADGTTEETGKTTDAAADEAADDEPGFFASLGEKADKFLDNMFSEDGKIAELFSEDGPLGELTGEGSLLEEFLSKIADKSSQLYQYFLNFIDYFTGEDGIFNEENAMRTLRNLGVVDENDNLNTEGFSQILKQLFSGSEETGELDPATIDAIFYSDGLMDKLETFILDRTKDNFEESDVSFMLPMLAGIKEVSDNTLAVFGDYWVYNYNNEDGKLTFASGGEFPGLITAVYDENGGLEITDYQPVGDGAAYWPDIEKFCAATGITTDYYTAATSEDARALSLNITLLEYMETHPEVTAVEIDGKFLNKEELAEATFAISDDELEETAQEIDEAAADLTDAVNKALDEAAEAVSGISDAVDEALGEAADAVNEASDAVDEALSEASDAVDEAADAADKATA